MAIEDRSPQIIAVGILFLTLAWVLTILRCYVRICMIQLFRSDDWLALATLGIYTIYCSFVLAGAIDGTGRHLKDLSQEDIVTAMKWWYCAEITYVLTTCLVKVYIGAFLRQTCTKRAQIITIWTTGIAFGIFSVYYLFLMTFQCHPISYFWIRYISGSSGSCVSPILIVNSTYTHSVLSAMVDWTLGTLPIFLVWNLQQMNTRTKCSVALILALGAVGSIATVIRVFYIHQLAQTQDFLFANTGVLIWSTVEPGMGIAASSLACLRPLFRSMHLSSIHLGSNTTVNNPGNLSRHRYFSSRSRNRPEELELQNNFAKAIRVTTVINTHSSRDTGRDVEVGMGGQIQEGSEITITSNREDGWNKNLSGDNTYEIGRFTPVSGESSVVCEASVT